MSYEDMARSHVKELKAAGWLPVVVWQHEDMAEAAQRIAVLHVARRRRRWPAHTQRQDA